MQTRKLYWRSLTAFRHVAGYVDNKLKPFYCPLQQRRNHGLYAVNLEARIGLFAQLNQCLRVLAYCDEHGLRPLIRLSSPFYVNAKGESWLEYFFENRSLNDDDKKRIKEASVRFSHVSDVDFLGLPANHAIGMTLEHANHLFWKYFRAKPDLIEYVDKFADRRFGDAAVLGLHFRGTDKKSEAKRVAWKYVSQTVSNYLCANPRVSTLFVASDEADFVDWIAGEFNQINVISHDDTLRSKNGIAIHVRPEQGDNYAKGREALINAMLLAKCDALVRTSSFLSAWSSIFNPSLPVVMLNRPFDNKLWFPDSLIALKSMNEYLPKSPTPPRNAAT